MDKLEVGILSNTKNNQKMKTQLLSKKIKLGIAFLHLVSLPLFAQQVPNGNFESWNNFGTFSEPASYVTLNRVYFGNPSFANKVAGYQSSSALQVLTVMKNGEYVIGGAATDSYPISNKSKVPTSLSGYYKCNMVGTDSAYIFVEIDELDGNYYHPIGSGGIALRGTVDTYTKFTFPITIDQATTLPMYYYLGVQSTHQDIKKPSGANTLTVDAFAFDFATSLEEDLLNASTVVVSSDQKNVTIDRMPSGLKEIHLLNLSGQTLLTHATSGNKVEMFFPSMPGGLYLLKISMQNSQVVKTLKVFIN